MGLIHLAIAALNLYLYLPEIQTYYYAPPDPYLSDSHYTAIRQSGENYR